MIIVYLTNRRGTMAEHNDDMYISRPMGQRWYRWNTQPRSHTWYNWTNPIQQWVQLCWRGVRRWLSPSSVWILPHYPEWHGRRAALRVRTSTQWGPQPIRDPGYVSHDPQPANKLQNDFLPIISRWVPSIFSQRSRQWNGCVSRCTIFGIWPTTDFYQGIKILKDD